MEGQPAKFAGESLAELQKLVEKKPDATLHELLDELSVEASIMAVFCALDRLDYRFKKSPSAPRSKTAPTSRSSVKRGAKKRSGF